MVRVKDAHNQWLDTLKNSCLQPKVATVADLPSDDEWHSIRLVVDEDRPYIKTRMGPWIPYLEKSAELKRETTMEEFDLIRKWSENV